MKGACDDVVLGNLTQTPANIKPAVADKNVVLTLDRIRERSAILRGMADKGEIGLTGVMYDVHTGQVTFM